MNDWEDFEERLAEALGWDDWYAVYSAVRGVQQMSIVERPPNALVTQADAAYLDRLAGECYGAVFILIPIAMWGTSRRWRHAPARLFRRLDPRDPDKQAQKLLDELGIDDDESDEQA